ncbi:hypothetical protein BV20DRAFT_754605 [Pilatotrama ljubarskyi]|nr:hypothetical protein BV20DRAFT_754605 [Pilatotrama ljubarskyi]
MWSAIDQRPRTSSKATEAINWLSKCSSKISALQLSKRTTPPAELNNDTAGYGRNHEVRFCAAHTRRAAVNLASGISQILVWRSLGRCAHALLTISLLTSIAQTCYPNIPAFQTGKLYLCRLACSIGRVVEVLPIASSHDIIILHPGAVEARHICPYRLPASLSNSPVIGDLQRLFLGCVALRP